MSRFMYFLGGCAAGVLAAAAVQVLTEDEYPAYPRTSSHEYGDDTDSDVDVTCCAENTSEESEPMDQNIRNMAEAMTNAMKNGMAKDGNTPTPCSADIQKMSEQLASSVIGIMSEFLRQSQTVEHRENEAAADKQEQLEDTSDLTKPITPNFPATQA